MGELHETLTGTPQGGVISPLLANISLHGMAAVLAISSEGQNRSPKKRAMVRYAGDFVVLCETEQDAVLTQEIVSNWLAIRGLQFSTDKTRFVHLTDGFDFLGFNIRNYPTSKTKSGWVTLTKPSKEMVLKIMERLRDEMLHYNGQNVTALIERLNPIIRGQANYLRTGVSSQTFHNLDYNTSDVESTLTKKEC